MSLSPPLVEQVYDALRIEVTWLHGRWICYRQLFAGSPERIDMLNECASVFFLIIQDVLLDEVMLSLSKLTDPAKTGKNENMSLEQLQTLLEAYGDAIHASKSRLILDKLHDQCAPFRNWRDKQLAHLDLHTSMKSSPNPLPGVSREMIGGALSTVRDYLNAIEQHYNDSEYGYENFMMGSDGDALLATIRNGLRYEELVQERTISYDDSRKGKWHDA